MEKEETVLTYNLKKVETWQENTDAQFQGVGTILPSRVKLFVLNENSIGQTWRK